MAKDNGNTSKWAIMLTRFGLGLLVVIAGAIVKVGYASINTKLDTQSSSTNSKLTEQSKKLDKLTVKIEELETAVYEAGTLGDSLQGRDIKEVKADLKDHIERHRP